MKDPLKLGFFFLLPKNALLLHNCFRKGMACSCSLKSHPGVVDVNVEALLCLVGPRAQRLHLKTSAFTKASNFPKPPNSLVDTDIN